MSSLKYTERNILEKILGMKTGYVSDFSDRTLKDFVLEVTGVDIFTEKYEEKGTSKANRIRVFWGEESDEMNAKLIEGLLEHAYLEKGGWESELPGIEERSFWEAKKIVQKLKDSSVEDVSEGRPSFIKIAKGAKAEGLTMVRNKMIGDADFVKNEGDIKDVLLKDNKHIVSGIQTKKSKNWHEEPLGIIFLGVLIVVIGGYFLYRLGWS